MKKFVTTLGCLAISLVSKPTAVLTILGVAIAGCSTTPVTTSQAKSVPAKRVMRPAFLIPQPGRGEVIVKRDTGFSGSAAASIIFADGLEIARLRTGEKVVFYLPDGEHIIGAKPDFIGTSRSEVVVQIKVAKPVILRVKTGAAGDYVIQPTTE